MRRHAIPILVVLVILGAVSWLAILALVPLYWIAQDRPLRVAIGGAVAITAATLASTLVWSGSPIAVISVAVLAAALVVTGRAVAGRRELLAERAATEERLRIARELHDAVGHEVSLMVVQAQALAATTPDEAARDGANAIADIGRRTMGEMHRTLRALRGDDAPLEPALGLAALDQVVDGARKAGVPITLTVEGSPRDLAPALDASAYRIVQEAVTNVIRHAKAPAAITVRYADALELTISDQGDGPTNSGSGGHGLIGMRERAELFGGTLAAGPTDSGFVVRATLPYAS
jgi:signal transduction histidine kinase